MECTKCSTTKSLRWKAGLCNSCYTKQWRERNAAHVQEYLESAETRFINSKKKAAQRKIEWKLSLEEYKTLYNKPCIYCTNKIGKKVTQSSGLDRLDNKVGYQIDNVVPCCNSCNLIKNETLSFEEMKKVAKFIIDLRDNCEVV